MFLKAGNNCFSFAVTGSPKVVRKTNECKDIVMGISLLGNIT